MWSTPRLLSESSGRGADGLRLEVRPVRLPHADLGGDDHVVAPATAGQPPSDDLLRLTAGVTVGRVDEIAARPRVRVEHREGALLVGLATEHVAPETEREHVEFRISDLRHGPTLRPRTTAYAPVGDG